MRALYVTQEYAPFFVEGGLGLTSRALPAALQQRHGLEHDVIMPYYPWLLERHSLATEEVAVLPHLSSPAGTEPVTVHRLLDHGGPCEVYLLRSDGWYDRVGIYRDEQYHEFTDAVARAAFFGRGVADWATTPGRSYDLVHANDWQSAAVLAHLRSRRGGDGPALILNVHSAAYQGVLDGELPDAYALPGTLRAKLEEYDRDRNGRTLLLAGLLSADAAVTCSPQYDRELPEHHAGTPLGDAWRAAPTTGVVSGVDPVVWDPSATGRSSVPYTPATVSGGKRDNRRLLRERLSLAADDAVPVAGVCGRCVEEKGTDLLLDALLPLVADGRLHLVVVGPAPEGLRERLTGASRRLPRGMAYVPHFDQELAWLVYAGSDVTVMPSRVEPCGLNQLIALAYGTLPVVTAVGGLRDTVTDLRTAAEEGNGFVIPAHTAEAVRDTVLTALRWADEDAGRLAATRRRVMRQDWSWNRTADEFASLYRLWTKQAAGGGTAPASRS
jgi:starch synthase